MLTHLNHYEFAAIVSVLMFGTVFLCVVAALIATAITDHIKGER
jgi:hypothetical protein